MTCSPNRTLSVVVSQTQQPIGNDFGTDVLFGFVAEAKLADGE